MAIGSTVELATAVSSVRDLLVTRQSPTRTALAGQLLAFAVFALGFATRPIDSLVLRSIRCSRS